MTLRCVVALGAVLSVLAIPARAGAQSAEAQDLFDQGTKALLAKDYATACQRLEASDRLERAVGTLMNLAECEEATGKLASARQHWQEAASWADATHDRLNRGAIARQRFDAVDKRVPRLTLQLAADAPKGSSVKRDGIDLGAALFGTALPVDPGKHTIVASASGRSDATLEVELKEGESKSLEVAPGAATPVVPNVAQPAALPATTTPSPASLETPVGTDAAGPGGSALKTVGFVVGGVGIVGLGVGTAFGLVAMSKNNAAQCDASDICGNPQSRRDAQGAATFSTISFVAGAALAAGGIALVLIAPKDGSPTGARLVTSPLASPGLGGVALQGQW